MTKPAPITDPAERRKTALVEAATSMIRELLDTHLSRVEQAAADTTSSTESDEPVKAKVAFSVTWPTGAQRPDVTVKLSYGIRISEEADRVVDPDQQLLAFEQEAQP
jgi:hypothetical protein